MDWVDLAERISAGDPVAAATLVSAMAGQLDHYCASIASDLSQYEREAVVEAALGNVVRHIDRFDPARATLPTWARAFVRYGVADARRGPREISGADYRFADQGSVNQDPAVAPEEPVWSPRELALTAILLSLSAADADLLYAHAVELLPFQVIADQLNADADADRTVSAASLRKRYQRARDRVIAAAVDDPELAPLLSAAEDNESTP